MQVITVAGRARTVQHLIRKTQDLLYGGFKILGWHSLGQPGVDGNDRFLLIISADGDTEYDFETQTERLKSSDTNVGVRLFDDMDSAIDYAREHYELSEDKIRAIELMENLTAEFPQMTAEEIERYKILDAFVRLGLVHTVPAKLHGERAVAIVTVTQGSDEFRMTPLAVLATDEVLAELELPVPER